MLRLTSALGKASAVGVSGALHAALLFTSLGHPPGTGGARLEPILVEVDVAPTPAPAAPEVPVPSVPPPNDVSAPPHHHTHPYPVPASHDATPHDPNLVHAQDAPLVPHEAATPATPPPVVAADAPVARFTMRVSSGPGPATERVAASPDVAAPGNGGPGGGADQGGPLPEQAVDSPARIARRVVPQYPSDARAEGLEAEVKLELVISTNGEVEGVAVRRGAGRGFDEAAVTAARQFRFAPAMKNGRPVRVRMSWSMEFRLL